MYNGHKTTRRIKEMEHPLAKKRKEKKRADNELIFTYFGMVKY